MKTLLTHLAERTDLLDFGSLNVLLVRDATSCSAATTELAEDVFDQARFKGMTLKANPE